MNAMDLIVLRNIISQSLVQYQPISNATYYLHHLILKYIYFSHKSLMKNLVHKEVTNCSRSDKCKTKCNARLDNTAESAFLFRDRHRSVTWRSTTSI